jgi:hypothetical protein
MRELAEKGDVMYEWAVCDCTSWERSYIIKEGDEWKPLKECPFCHKGINLQLSIQFGIYGSGMRELAQGEHSFKAWYEKQSKVKCPSCGHEFTPQ